MTTPPSLREQHAAARVAVDDDYDARSKALERERREAIRMLLYRQLEEVHAALESTFAAPVVAAPAEPPSAPTKRAPRKPRGRVAAGQEGGKGGEEGPVREESQATLTEAAALAAQALLVDPYGMTSAQINKLTSRAMVWLANWFAANNLDCRAVSIVGTEIRHKGRAIYSWEASA